MNTAVSVTEGGTARTQASSIFSGSESPANAGVDKSRAARRNRGWMQMDTDLGKGDTEFFKESSVSLDGCHGGGREPRGDVVVSLEDDLQAIGPMNEQMAAIDRDLAAIL